MHKTTQRESKHPITVDVKNLAARLGCGESTARKIGEQSHAKIVIGRRVLYSVDKVKAYLDSLTD